MIGLYIQFEGLLRRVPTFIPSFSVGPVLLGDVVIEALLGIEREFFGGVRKMMRPITILIQRNALLQVSGSDTLLGVGCRVFPVGERAANLLFYSRITLF
jgi:hypothetical protein